MCYVLWLHNSELDSGSNRKVFLPDQKYLLSDCLEESIVMTVDLPA